MAAPAAHPFVTVRMPGPLGTPTTWTAQLVCWVRRGDGWHADVVWRENADGAERVALLPAEYVQPVGGEDYRRVPRREAARVERRGLWRYQRRPA